MNRKPDMVAKIASQAGSLYGEALKAFNDAESNYSLNSVSDMCSAKKDLFEVSCAVCTCFVSYRISVVCFGFPLGLHF